MAYFICEKQGRCCPHEFYNSIEQAITDSEDGVPCDHLIEVAPVVHGQWVDNGIPDSILSGCSVCGFTCGSSSFFYCPKCGARMDGGGGNSDMA